MTSDPAFLGDPSIAKDVDVRGEIRERKPKSS
jgi:hypothetical protein